MKLCACEHNIPGATFAERIAYLDRLEVEGVELTLGEQGLLKGSLRPRITEIVGACASTRVRPTFITTQIRDLLDSDPERRGAADAAMMDQLETAAAIGAVGVTLVPRFGLPSLPDLSPLATQMELEHELFVRKMRPLADEARRLGVIIVIEPLNRYLATFLTKVAHAKRICHEVGSPALRILVDNFQSYHEEFSIVAAIREAGDDLAHVHISENTRRLPPQGSTDFSSIVQSLKEIGYTGYLSFECDVSGGRLEQQFGAAVDHMRTLLR